VNSPTLLVDQKINFKLEEEEKLALLLHLPKLYAETADIGLAFGFYCLLVVGVAQARAGETAIF
jgi:hypothetical protein